MDAAPSDSAVDGGISEDASRDLSVDVTPDATSDLGATPDATSDLGADATADATSDLGVDSAPDATSDLGMDAIPDAMLPPPCDPNNPSIICEFFEDNRLVLWTRYADLTGTVIVNDRPYSGTSALRATINQPEGKAGIAQNIVNLTSGEIWIRVRVRPTDNTQFSFFASYENQAPFNGIALSMVGTKLEGFVAGPDVVALSGNSFLMNEWNCVLARVLIGDAGELEISLNGGVPDLISTDTLPVGGLDGVDTGITYTPAGVSSASADIDELIVSHLPLSCD